MLATARSVRETDRADCVHSQSPCPCIAITVPFVRAAREGKAARMRVDSWPIGTLAASAQPPSGRDQEGLPSSREYEPLEYSWHDACFQGRWRAVLILVFRFFVNMQYVDDSVGRGTDVSEEV
jgi:hypothetical protein